MTTENNKTNFIDFMVTSAAQTIIKSEFEDNNNTCNNNNNNSNLIVPNDFGIEYWNSPSELSIEKDDPSIWETSLIEDSLRFFKNHENHVDSSSTDPCDTSGGDIIYTTLTALSDNTTSPSITLEHDPTITSNHLGLWYSSPPPPQHSSSPSPSLILTNQQQDENVTTPTTSSTTSTNKIVPNIEDLDTFLNIIPNSTTISPTSTWKQPSPSTIQQQHDWIKQDTQQQQTEWNKPEQQTMLWKQSSSSSVTSVNDDNDSLLRNALEGKSIFKYNNNNNDYVLSIKDDSSSTNDNIIITDNNNTIIYPIDNNSNQSIDDYLQIINNNNNNNGEFSKINDELSNGNSIEIYYSVDNINVNYTTINNNDSTIQNNVSNTVKKKKIKKINNNNNNVNECTSSSNSSNNNLCSNNNNNRKERSLHYCEICNKGFKDKYSVNVHVRTHTGEKPFPCKICCKTFRQKAHLAKHFQTHLTPSNSNNNSKHNNKIMKTVT